MAAAEATSPSLTSSQVTPKQYVLAGGTTLLNAEAAAIWEQALAKASAYIVELLTRADRDSLLNEVFGRAGTEATVFEANKQALLEAIGTTGLKIAIDLRSGTEMEGAIGAYAQVGPNGHEIIYINADWINAGNLSLEQLTAVVLEEYGHALDVRLNPGLESAGDEGELFANLITNAGLNADQIAAINTQNDWGTVQVDGQTVAVEQRVVATATGVSSTTLGIVLTATQTINRATAQALSVTITYNGVNSNGADILIAAYNGTTLIGWTVYNRSTNLDAGGNSSTLTLTLTFNLAQFNPSFSSGGLNFRAWQGTAGGATAVGTADNALPATATTSGTSSTVPFAVNTITANTSDVAIPAETDGGSVTWTATSVDAVAPTVTISDNVAGTATGATTFTFTFSEVVTGFDTSKVTVGNGTKGTFSGSGNTYTLVVTPDANEEGNITVDVSTTGVTDAAGNPATAPAQYTQSFDTLAPTLSITDSVAGTATGATTFTFTFSEAVTGFSSSNVTVGNGTPGTFTAVSSTVYTLVVTPTPASSGNITVDVSTTGVTDAVGNTATAPAQYTQSFDTLAPTVSITDNVAGTATGDVTFTFTFSEAVTGFDTSKVTVGNGTKGTFTPVSSTEYTLVVTPTGSSSGNITVDVITTGVIDAAGNQATAPDQYTQAFDTAAPTVLITDNVEGVANGDVTFTFTFSEAIGDFTAGDITVSGGTKGTFSMVNETTYNLVVSPTGTSSTINVSVPAGAATDSAGNGNLAAGPVSQEFNTAGLTLNITDNTAGIATGAVLFTFTFTQDVNGFTADDINLSAGDKGAFTVVSASQYTLLVTPPANQSGTITVTVAAGAANAVSGGAGNLAPAPHPQAFDTAAPTLSIISNTSTLKAGDTATITFNFSEAVSNFTLEDVSVSGGSLSALTGSGSSYTATFTPTADSTANASISVASGTFTDLAGNANATASNTLAFTVDTVRPTIAISSNVPALKAGETATISFTLSEASTDFTAADVSATGGTLSNFAGSGTSYSATFTPTPNSTTSASISVASGAFTDPAGNTNATASNTLAITVDTAPPSVVISDNVVGGANGDVTFTFTFSEAVTGFDTSKVNVGNGTKGTFAGSGNTYTLVVTPTASSSGNITVDVITTGVIDAAGNQATAPAQYIQAFDTAAPTVVITDNAVGVATGDVTFTFTFSEAVNGFTADDITVSGGTRGTFTTVDATTYRLVVSPTGVSGTINVSVPAGGATDSAGNGNIASVPVSQDFDTRTIRVTPDTYNINAGVMNYSVTTNTNGSIGADLLVAIYADSNGTSNLIGWQVVNRSTAFTSGSIYNGSFNFNATQLNKVNNTATISVRVWQGTAGSDYGTGNDNSPVITYRNATTITGAVAGFTINSTNLPSNTGNAGAKGEIILTGTVTAGSQQVLAINTVTVDTIAPSAAVAITAISDDTGTAGDFITNDTSLSVSGTNGALGAGETIQISSDGGSTWANVVVSGTTWSYADPTTRSSPFTYQVRVIDTAGNVGSTASRVITVDTVAPSVAITDNDPNTVNSADGTVTFTFTFSEAVTGFDTNKVSVGNGTKGTFTAVSSTVYTLVVTPDAGEEGNITVDVNTTGVTDVAANTATVPAQYSQGFDTLRPTIAISSNVSTLKAGETATITFTLSEASTNFTAADVSATGGVLSNFSGSGTAYTATFTPDAGSTTNGVISVASATFSDAAGNTNNDGGDANNSVTLTVDTAAPNAPSISTVTDDVSPVTGTVASGGSTNDTVLVLAGTAEANSTVTVRNSGSSLGTTTANGSGVWSFTTAALNNGTIYTFNATATDAAGNVSSASANYAVTVDTTAPTATVAITAVVSDTGISSSDYITSDTTLVVNGSNSSLGSGEKVQISTDGSTWADVSMATATTWTYTDPTIRTSNLTYQVRVIDTAGNVGNIASQAITIAPDGTSGEDNLIGNAESNTIDGGDGNDTIDGGLGDDYLIGGLGNDSLIGGLGNDSLIGGSGTDTLSGGAGTDLLYGDSGADSLVGGDGFDTLIGGDGADSLNGGAGSDTVSYAPSIFAVTVTVNATTGNTGGDAAGDALFFIENLIGSDFSDSLTGNASANNLNGGAGNDTLTGLAAKDTLTGGAGADWFWYKATTEGGDTITDFSVADADRLVFTTSAFGGIIAVIGGTNFFASTNGAPSGTTAQFLYNTSSGLLSYDSNGSTVGGNVAIATLTGIPEISESSFLMTQ
jgi:Ca2+-binding RTX toxin-like protein